MARGQWYARGLVRQQETVGDDFALERLAAHLKSTQHGTSAVDEDFAVEKPVRDWEVANHVAAALGAVDAQRDANAARFAIGDSGQKFTKAKLLRAVQDRLAMKHGGTWAGHTSAALLMRFTWGL